MKESKESIDAADPNRCQAVTGRGQCSHPAVEGYQFCAAHRPGGAEKARQERVRHYLLANPDLAQRYDRHGAIAEIRSLRDEIAIARTMMGKRLDMVENNSDFLAACGPVNSYLQTIEKLTTAFHKMEVSLNNLLSKASISALAQEIITILVDELNQLEGYEEIIDRISERIAVVVAKQENDTTNN